MNATQRRKARDRTRAWREARQGAGLPEAREIDRALAAALVHVTTADRDRGLMLPPELVPAIVTVAAFILKEGHGRRDAAGFVEDRLQALAKEVAHARDRQACAAGAYTVRGSNPTVAGFGTLRRDGLTRD